jgi:hypothetical protein
VKPSGVARQVPGPSEYCCLLLLIKHTPGCPVPDPPEVLAAPACASKSRESSPLELAAAANARGPGAVVDACCASPPKLPESNALPLIPALVADAGPAAAVGVRGSSEPLPKPVTKAAQAEHSQHVYPMAIEKCLAIRISAPRMMAATKPTATRIQLMLPAWEPAVRMQ